VSDPIDSVVATEPGPTQDAPTADDLPEDKDVPEAGAGDDQLPVPDDGADVAGSEGRFWRLAKKGLAGWGHEPSVEEMAGYWRGLIDETHTTTDEPEGQIAPERTQDPLAHETAPRDPGESTMDEAAGESNETTTPEALLAAESTTPAPPGDRPDDAVREEACAAPTPTPTPELEVTPEAVSWLMRWLAPPPTVAKAATRDVASATPPPVHARPPDAASRFAPPRPGPPEVSHLVAGAEPPDEDATATPSPGSALETERTGPQVGHPTVRNAATKTRPHSEASGQHSTATRENVTCPLMLSLTGLLEPTGSEVADDGGPGDAGDQQLAVAGCLALLEAAELADARACRPVGLSRAGLAFADGLVLLERRRRAQQARRRWGRQIALPEASLDAHERELRHGVDTDAANLLEVALRAAAAGVGAAGLPSLSWVEASSHEVTLALATPAPAPPGFVHAGDAQTGWSTAADLEELERLGAPALIPWPALVPLGATIEGRELLIDLEGLGVVRIDGPPDDALGLLRSILVSLATATWSAPTRVVVVGLEPELDDLPGVESVEALDDALNCAEAHAHSVIAALEPEDWTPGGQTRTVWPSTAPQALDTLVVVSALAPQNADTGRRVAALAGRRCPGVGLVMHDPAAAGTVVDSDAGTVRIGTTGALHIEGPTSRVSGLGPSDPAALPPSPRKRDLSADLLSGDGGVVGGVVGQRVWARRLDAVDVRGLVALLDSARQRDGGEVALRPRLRRGSSHNSIGAGASLPGREELATDVDLVVRVLGDIEIVRLRPGSEERLEATLTEALEVVAYLALRERSVTYGTLEVNLYPHGAGVVGTVEDVVAAARDLIGPALLRSPAEGRVAVSERVITDYGMFCGLFAQADEAVDTTVAAELLTSALGLVRSGPLGGLGQRFTWAGPQREAIVSHVVDAAEMLAQLCAARRDWDAVEWAVGQGLKAAPGAERLHRWLMRSAHAVGDLARVHDIFDALCDLVADPTVGVEPEDTLQAETVDLLETLVSRRAALVKRAGVAERHVLADLPLPVTAEMPQVAELPESTALSA
jgi:DNA-binding SARP family transcriptional activator